MQKSCGIIIIFLNTLLSVFGAECPNILTRYMWGGLPAKSVEYMTIPVQNVIVTHSVTSECKTVIDCAEIVENIRAGHMDVNGWDDIGFNFLIGGDGNVYEGTGWHRIGAHTIGWNSKSIGICFIGDFSKKLPNQQQLEAAKNLLKCGVTKGELATRYKLIAQRQVIATASPGLRLYQEIQRWDHWTSSPS
ncbi:peptidoglycan-recognition protein SA-like [Chrysoperla carnea]|uniref:peptidoglycan-recognition protein SA-like n=1 Tax=Chrysoperla carnea TaxID=189513 RepID=UPI001D06F128|nr:peptidoglycan-recognition protein SA-like [Chrysoperla carnea]